MTEQQPRALTETNRARRGHAFYPPADALARIPHLYATETIDAADRIVHLHYFTASSDWWVTELDQATGVAYGYACLNGDGLNAGRMGLRQPR